MQNNLKKTIYQQQNLIIMKKLILTAALLFVTFIGFAQKPSPALLDPTNHTLVLIDYESQMAFAVSNIPIDQLRNNTALVAGASKIFKVPTIVTTVAEKSFRFKPISSLTRQPKP